MIHLNGKTDRIAGKLIAFLRDELNDSTIEYDSPLTQLQGGYETATYQFQLKGVQKELNKRLMLRLYPEFYWSRDRNGRPHVKKRTSRSRLRRSISDFTAWIKASRSMKLGDLIEKLNSKLRGYFNYFGVICNYRSLYEFFYHVRFALWKWLRRRSQRTRLSWERFTQLLKRLQLQRPFINERRGRRSRLMGGVC